MGGQIEDRAGWALVHRAAPEPRGEPKRTQRRRRDRAGAAFAVLGLAIALTLPVGLRAATLGPAGVTFTVTSTSDAVDANLGNGVCASSSGACTLRAAIQQANALAGADTIVLPAGTYELAIPPLNQNLADVGDLDIADSLTISGNGAGSTIVDGGSPTAGAPARVRGLDRLFEVLVDDGEVTFSGLTFSDGYAAEYGGAIMNNSAATVTVMGSTLTGNVADKAGGAIDNHVGGVVEVVSSTLTNNVSFESGSALNNQRDGTLTIANSTISSNSAADIALDESLAGAGAIANNAELDAQGTISVTGSQISDNAAGGSRSGAALSNDGAGTVAVQGTAFTKNRAHVDGGAIFNGDGDVTVVGSTFSENAGQNGGAIFNSAKDGSLSVSDSTFSLNEAAARGGAIATGGTGALDISDSTFAKNSAGGWGGAIVNDDKGGVAIRNSTFTENSGLNGGGFGNEGDGLVTVENSTFTKNSAFVTSVLASGEGGGMQSNSSGEVVITGGAFIDNRARDGGGLGNEGGGQVTITGTRFSANTADEKGGGILIQSGTVRMVDIDVIGNVANAAIEAGGGIAYEGDKLVSVGEAAAIENSRIRDNKAKGQGGGIDSRGDGPLDILTTTIAGNTAAMGGGIHHVGDAPLEVIRSTLSANLAENGGGLFTDGDGETTVVNSTVSGNRAGQFGGGLLVSSRLNLRNSTVANNTAASGGGINNGGGDLVGDGTVLLANTIVANSPTGGNCAGGMNSLGGNVDSGNTCQFRELSDQPGTDPLLGPLADNGGLTQTHALLADSPAQEKAVCTDVDPCPSVDQRGTARPLFAGFDAGAYESELTPAGGSTPTQPCAGRTERPVPADYDTWVAEGTPTSNFGADSILKVKSLSGGNQRALIHFTLPAVPPSCNLVGAILRVQSSSATDGRALEVLRLDSEWSETGVTWASQPETAGAAATTQSGIGVREWNVLTQTHEMYDLGGHGFLIQDAAEGEGGEQSLHASEKGADNPPVLVLVFDSPGAPPLGDECPTTPQSLFADRDSWVSQGSPTNNFGTDSTLKVKSQAGYNARALVSFTLPTLPARCTGIASATLRLEASSATDLRTLEVRRIGSGWSESVVNWNNQPGPTGAAVSIPSFDGTLEWGVTGQVVDMYLSANHGFLIQDAEEGGVGEEQTLNGRLKLNDGPPELVLVFDDSTPETAIGAGPDPETEESEATFTFSSDRADATFECSLDSGAFTACEPLHIVRGLPLGDHVLEVRATRPIRAVDPTPARRSWRVADLTPPLVTLTGPAAEVEETTAALEFSADEPVTFACSLDGIAVADCASPLELTALALGPHTFELDATDASGNVGSASLDWTIVDRTAPVVTLSGPDTETEERSAELTFSASEDAVFACSLNGLEIASCTSPQTLAGLALGEYEFAVSATDGSGNVGLASVAWTVVDVTAPVVTLTGPPARTEETSATLDFSVNEEAVLNCSLDGKAVPACVSPLARDTLRLGVHVFEVSATDPSGNTATAVHEWEIVDETAPVVTLEGPVAETEDTSATFTFSADEPATLTCALDAVLLATCESPLTQDGLPLGRHHFEVSATDASGNTGKATHDWEVVDVTAPTVTLSGPEGETEETSATLTFSADEPGTLACALDGVPLETCASPLSLSGLAIGEHVVEVSATDASGNTGSARHGWTIVDRTEPSVILNGPDDMTELTDATFTFSANEPADFACTVDGAVVAECASPLTVSALALGEHRFELTAMDRSGNVTSVVHRWTVVDNTVPVVTLDGPTDTEETSATFNFSTDEAATLECSLDDAPLETCESPLTREGLALGSHTFQVAATDPSGNTGTAVHTWSVVDRTAPVVTLTGPEAETESADAELAFSANEEAAFACSLDGVGIPDCASPISRSGLALGPHRFEVTAEDASGNTGSATHLWAVVDRTPPVLTLDGPTGETEETSATLTFSASEPATLTCALDDVAVLPCESPLTRSGLLLGPHTFGITATDASGNAASASQLWTIVDKTAPELTLTGPADETEDRSASFTFSATESAQVECRLDDAVFAACPSGAASYSGLALGAHRFDVRATDAAGNTASAAHRWTIVDRSLPVVTINGPAAETSGRSATLTFSADEAVTFTCALDGATPAGCTAPVELTELALGPHSFVVEATDSAGNVGTVTHTWRIVPPPDTSAPVITLAGPAHETNETTAQLTFSANEAVTGFRCSLDDAAPAGCTSPVDLAGLALGAHTFRVEATDLTGNAGAATHAWTVKVAPDTTAPVVTIAGPPATTTSTSATLTFTADEPATFRCALDSEPFAACESGVTHSGLGLGEHVFRVEATDGALNQSLTGHTWTIVDSSAPAVTISSGPTSPTTATSARFEFSADEPATFRCARDGGAAETCASGVTYTDLAVGEHSFEVLATDTAGNVGSADYVWSIDPPQDVTSPVVTITSGPASGTTATTAAFAFSASEPATFGCVLDGGTLAECATGVSYSGLAAGPHTFRVEARDAAGNVGSATWSWTIAAPPPAGCTSQTLTLGAAADTWLLESSASSNYGQDSVIKVDTKAGANARSLLRFQLPVIPSGCTLREAKLRLYASSFKTSRTLLAVPAASSWLEGSVTWTTQPATTGSGVAAASGGGYIEWSVTPLLSGASGDVSFLVRDANENGNGIEQGFHSREKGTDNPPRLVVTFG